MILILPLRLGDKLKQNGFLIKKTTASGHTTYNYSSNYSSQGELLSVNLPDGKAITYDHDPLGRRIAKQINGAVTEKYLWKDNITLLTVYDGSNNLLMRTYIDRLDNYAE